MVAVSHSMFPSKKSPHFLQVIGHYKHSGLIYISVRIQAQYIKASVFSSFLISGRFHSTVEVVAVTQVIECSFFAQLFFLRNFTPSLHVPINLIVLS